MAGAALKRAIQRTQYLWKTTGPRRMLRRLVAQLLSPIYRSEELYVSVSRNYSAPEDDEFGPGAVGREIIESSEGFEAVRPYLHHDVDASYIASFLEERPTRFAALYRYEQEDGTPVYFGWTTFDRGYFEMPEYRFRGELPEDFLAGYEVEIVPGFRGRGFGNRGRAAMRRYQEALGAFRTLGVIRSHNVVSLNWASGTYDGTVAELRGPIRMSRWFGSRIVRTPSWAEFRALVEAPLPEPPEDSMPPAVTATAAAPVEALED